METVCRCNSTYRLRYWNFEKAKEYTSNDRKLQQYLPFTVLKRQMSGLYRAEGPLKLQQYLPFTVLKQQMVMMNHTV